MKPVFILVFFFLAFVTGAQEYYFRQMPTDDLRDVQHIKVLFQGSDQMVWIGTDKGLFSFDGKTLRYAPRPDGLSSGVTTIAESSPGEIWAGFDDGLLYSVSTTGVIKIFLSLLISIFFFVRY